MMRNKGVCWLLGLLSFAGEANMGFFSREHSVTRQTNLKNLLRQPKQHKTKARTSNVRTACPQIHLLSSSVKCVSSRCKECTARIAKDLLSLIADTIHLFRCAGTIREWVRVWERVVWLRGTGRTTTKLRGATTKLPAGGRGRGRLAYHHSHRTGVLHLIENNVLFGSSLDFQPCLVVSHLWMLAIFLTVQWWTNSQQYHVKRDVWKTAKHCVKDVHCLSQFTAGV